LMPIASVAHLLDPLYNMLQAHGVSFTV
jgi:hypothetical protein